MMLTIAAKVSFPSGASKMTKPLQSPNEQYTDTSRPPSILSKALTRAPGSSGFLTKAAQATGVYRFPTSLGLLNGAQVSIEVRFDLFGVHTNRKGGAPPGTRHPSLAVFVVRFLDLSSLLCSPSTR